MSSVTISGGGMVGVSLAIALAKAGIQVNLVEREDPSSFEDKSHDGRVSAIAYGSVQWLKSLGVWEKLMPHACPIQEICVSEAKAPTLLQFDSKDAGADCFGYIVENRYLRRALWEQLRAYDFTLFTRTAIQDIRYHPHSVEIALEIGKSFSTDLLISAEGKFSPLRDKAGISCLTADYRQTAIVCTLLHRKPHQNVAQERFLPQGPFAILPMTEDDEGRYRSSIVWVETPETAKHLVACSKEAFLQELKTRYGEYLEIYDALEPRFTYPLSLLHAHRYVAGRLVLVGDCAHTMHPLAGQGVNIGFRDTKALSELLISQAKLGGDLGSPLVLKRYERLRRADTMMMLAMTDGLNRLFSNKILPLRLARAAGFALVHRLPFAKKFFMREAMGKKAF